MRVSERPILSIAAIKKGAKKVIGFDIDEWAINNGLENALQNEVSNLLELRKGSFDVIEERGFDVIFCEHKSTCSACSLSFLCL